ncbi:MAG: hypothetical protein LBK63_12290 [Treponema sp.]|nr:hypothetical protein [Treponema sp.]
MKKKGLFTLAWAAVALALTACPNVTNGGDHNNNGNQAEAVGRLTGTIQLTGYTGTRPAVGINAEYYAGQSNGGWVDDRGENHPVDNNGSFSIPFTQKFLDALDAGEQTLRFRLYIGSGNDVFSKNIETTKTATKTQLSGPTGDKSLSVGSLDSENIAVITLSGTITVTVDGQAVPRVEIVATPTGSGSWLGSTQLTTPGANTAWSIRLPARESAEDLNFAVYGYDSGGNRIFEKRDAATVTGVSNANKTGIAINLGNIQTITLSGTITVTDDGNPIPRVYIEARAGSGNSSSTIGSTSLTSPAAGAAWSITIPAQEAQQVRFYVYGYDNPNGGGNQVFYKSLEPDQTASVSGTSISGITLNIGDINVGRMSGTVTFTNMPDPAPYYISLTARYGSSGNTYINNGSGSRIDLSGAAGTWTIPQDSAFLEALEGGDQTVTFSVYLQLEQNANGFTVAQVEKTVSKTSLASVNLGDVSLALVTLSGTLTVTDDGEPIPRVVIGAYSTTSSFSTSLASPAAGAAWSITIPAQEAQQVRFTVYGYDDPNGGGNQVFYKTLEPDQTASVSNTSISGIALDIGDINVGRMSGTVTFTNMPDPAPYYISLTARYGSNGNTYINNGSGSRIDLSGNTGTWAIPQDNAFLEALDGGDQTVTFSLYLQLEQNENGFTIAQVEKTLSKTGLASVNLGNVSLATVTLSGTLNVSVNSQTPHMVYIYVDTTSGNIGYTYVNSPGANTPWSIRLPPFETATDISFRIYIYDSNGTQLVTANNVADAKNVFNQNVSNIAITYAFPPSSAASLTIDQWADGSLEPGKEAWHLFQANGSDYYVSWNDRDAQTDKTCDVRVTAYTSNGSVVSGWQSYGEDSGWTTPKAVSGQSGTVYLQVKGNSDTSSGTYAVKYSQSSAGNISTPTNLSASVSGSSVYLGWHSVSGASSYKVYRSNSESGPYDQIGNPSSASYTDSNLSAGTYYYKVSAVSSGGTESLQSDSASATVSGGGGGGGGETLTPDIDASLLGTWKDDTGELLSVTFTSTTVTWGGSAGSILNTTTDAYQGTNYSFVWVAGDGNISYKFSYMGGTPTSIPVYGYTISGNQLALTLSGTTFVTLTKQ